MELAKPYYTLHKLSSSLEFPPQSTGLLFPTVVMKKPYKYSSPATLGTGNVAQLSGVGHLLPLINHLIQFTPGQ